jgi:hypothetical protein
VLILINKNNMKKQYFKFNKTYSDSSIICEGSVLVKIEEQTFKKNGDFISNKIFY